ncbi:VOC family protein [Actinokineospora guangxiensis]|uniref:VOC family protein n=1 Tax=Actinokineospora guangxiensis TaxID=1490288 RepID=A0ABW0EMR8_9PSEU
MPSRLNPYISFDGTAREAMEFYRSVFGGTLVVNTFGEYGVEDPEQGKRVMHAMLETDGGYTIMAADTMPGMPHNPGDSVSVSLSGDDTEELRGYWAKLAEGAQVATPLEKQVWGDEFGACTDRFGVSWMVNIAGAAAG